MPPFTEHSLIRRGDDSIDQGPAGGRHLGRPRAVGARAGAAAAVLAVRDGQSAPRGVVAKVQRAPYAAQFRDAFGDRVFADPRARLQGGAARPGDLPADARGVLSLQQQVRCLAAGKASLGDAGTARAGRLQRSGEGQLRALSSERDARGRISAVHGLRLRRARRAAQPGHPRQRGSSLLRSRAVRAAAHRLKDAPNIAACSARRPCATSRASACFFHNGVFHRLEDVVRFYAERDTAPEKWYPRDATAPR